MYRKWRGEHIKISILRGDKKKSTSRVDLKNKKHSKKLEFSYRTQQSFINNLAKDTFPFYLSFFFLLSLFLKTKK